MSDDRDFWDLPGLNPRIGKRAKPERQGSLNVAVIRRLARMANRLGTGGSARRGTTRRAGHDIRPASTWSRRCVVKAHYVQLRAGGEKATRDHLGYIERDGVEQDGSLGRMFDSHGNIDRKEFGATLPEEKRQFRFIISPEDGNELDLRKYTAALMERVGADLGRKLRWAAVCHYNTDNPHVHVVVRGVDTRGGEVRIDRSYISNGLRLRAQELATRELGPRTELDFRRQISAEISQERLTSIDRRLAGLVSLDGVIEMSSLAHASIVSRPHALARLETLESLDLVERTSPTSWRVTEGWQETLRELGERGDLIKRMHRALEGRASSYRVFQPGPGATVEGTIKHKGLHDELAGDPYVIIQTARREAVYVRLDPAAAAPLREGATVRFACETQRWVKATDHVIQREAAANAGIYDPTAHQRSLGDTPIAISGRLVEPKDVIAVNVRRLERLERYQLVERQPGGRWRVPVDLVRQLADRERTHPQHALRVEPIGPELVPTMGTIHGRPKSAEREILDVSGDRAALGQVLAKQHRETFVSDPPTFRGWAVDCAISQGGREYARIVNYARGEFTLVAKPPDWERLHGHTVQLSRDREQKLAILLDRGLSR
jgi:type IV secretory pathway VirD2 relaxase